MEQWKQEHLQNLREEKTSYADMIEYCCNNTILNNNIIEELTKKDFYFETFCGSDRSFYNGDGDEITEEEYYNDESGEAEEVYDDIYQYFIISSNDAERLADYTNQLVLYNEDVDIYLLCVKHYGTALSGCPSDWKEGDKCN